MKWDGKEAEVLGKGKEKAGKTKAWCTAVEGEEADEEGEKARARRRLEEGELQPHKRQPPQSESPAAKRARGKGAGMGKGKLRQHEQRNFTCVCNVNVRTMPYVVRSSMLYLAPTRNRIWHIQYTSRKFFQTIPFKHRLTLSRA